MFLDNHLNSHKSLVSKLLVGLAIGLWPSSIATMAIAAPPRTNPTSLKRTKLQRANRKPVNANAAPKTAVEIDAPFLESTTYSAPAATEMTEITEADGTTVILPPGYEAGRAYPALVLMPYTNRSALHMFNWGIYEAYHQRTENAFILIMPPGQGSSANWSGYGWEAFVDEYERYVQQELAAVTDKYNVDRNQLVVGGFSLGGDLSWTLSLRNPDLFKGAIVMGSMSTYRDELNAQRLAERDFRYFMVMGGYDGNRSNMYSALNSLDAHNIDYHYEEVGSAGHGDLPEQMENDLFLSAMDYILAAQTALAEQTTGLLR